MPNNEYSQTNYEKDLADLATAIKQNNTEQSLDLIKKIPAQHLFYFDELNDRTHLQNAINLGNDDVASAIIGKKEVTAAQLLSRDLYGKTALDDAIRLKKSRIILEILPKTIRMLPNKTVEEANAVIKAEIAELDKHHTIIDRDELEKRGLKEILEKKPLQQEGAAVAREIDRLESLYNKSDALIRRSKQVRPAIRFLTYDPQERQR
jgi:hypothetical protein